MSTLPSGWKSTRLGDVLELKYGKGLPEKERIAGPVNVYGSNGRVGTHKAAITGAPAIVIGRKGSIGEVHLSHQPCFPIDTTYYVDKFGGCDVGFIFHLLKFLPLTELDRASAIPGLNREDAYGLEVSLAPLVEQRRIVAKIDSLSAKSERVRHHLDHVPRLVEKYKQAVLAAAFRGELTETWRTAHPAMPAVVPRAVGEIKRKFSEVGDFEAPFDLPSSWRWLRLPQIGELDRGKSRHRPRDDDRLFGGQYPFIQTGEVRQADHPVPGFRADAAG